MTQQQQYHFPHVPESYRPNQWDAIIFVVIFALFALLASSAAKMAVPYALGEQLAITLEPHALPGYAMRTVIRMFVAMGISLIFTLIFGTLAAKSRRAERIIIPAVDVLQSVPVLGFLSITIVGFILLFPNSLLGPECAAIFAIFTSQAWSMILSVYQSIKTVPHDLQDAANMYRLSGWQRFWRLEMPFALPPLLWNMMMSMSAGWFFVVAAEAISVANQKIFLPGMGSYIAVAIDRADMLAVGYAILTMFIVILMYDQLLFRPLIKWSEKFRMDEASREEEASSWVLSLFRRSRLFYRAGLSFSLGLDAIINIPWLAGKPLGHHLPSQQSPSQVRKLDILWDLFLLSVVLISIYLVGHFVLQSITMKEVGHVFYLGAVTALRIILLIIVASLIWVPIGVWVGMRPRVREVIQPIAQFCAAFPANLLFPLFVLLIVKYSLSVNIWTTPLMIIGNQWYILFNVIAGAGNIPKDLCHVAANFGVKRWLWWKRLALPAIFPCYITGALTAAGGAWNASIVAEFVNWGDTTLIATGLGAYITQVTTIGDFPRIFLGIGVMCIYVITCNVLFWQRLYRYAQARYQMQ
jgi:NitT/TauT family transport system permease protein